MSAELLHVSSLLVGCAGFRVQGKQLKGPSALSIDSRGNMFFCDSGPLGETTLQATLLTLAALLRCAVVKKDGCDGLFFAHLEFSCVRGDTKGAVPRQQRARVIIRPVITRALCRLLTAPSSPFQPTGNCCSYSRSNVLLTHAASQSARVRGEC